MSTEQLPLHDEIVTPPLQAVAERLNTACRNGALQAAYAIVKPYSGLAQAEVMLRAGFSTIGGDRKGAALDHQRQIAEACKAKKDGWEMLK